MANDPFYKTKAWQKLRSKVLARWRYLGLPCGHCGAAIDWSARPITDHIENRKQRPDLALEVSNLQVLHSGANGTPPCNTLKYYHKEINDKIQVGLDGYPEGWGG